MSLHPDTTPMTADDLRLFAKGTLDAHTPVNQDDNPTAHTSNPRCGLCHFTRHPCDTFDLAAHVLLLLDMTAPNVETRSQDAIRDLGHRDD